MSITCTHVHTLDKLVHTVIFTSCCAHITRAQSLNLRLSLIGKQVTLPTRRDVFKSMAISALILFFVVFIGGVVFQQLEDLGQYGTGLYLSIEARPGDILVNNPCGACFRVAGWRRDCEAPCGMSFRCF